MVPLKAPAMVAQSMRTLHNTTMVKASTPSGVPSVRGLAAQRPPAPQLVKLGNLLVESPTLSRSSSTESTASSLADAVKLHMQGGLLKQAVVNTPESTVQRKIGFYRGQPRDQASVELRNELSSALTLRARAEAHAPSKRLGALLELQVSGQRDLVPSGSAPSSPSSSAGKSGWSFAPASPGKEPKLMEELSQRLQAVTLKQQTQGPDESTA